jgi:hypothetical protein
MPSLRDVAHDGVLCTIRKVDQTQTGASGVARQGRRHGEEKAIAEEKKKNHRSANKIF